MIRKWMTLLLAMMLALSLPLGALADTQHTLTVHPGELLASEQVAADLLDAVDLRLTQGDRSGALTVVIKDQEVLTLGLTADVTGLYASSALFGSDVLYATWDDAFAALTDLSVSAMQQQGVTDPAVIQAIEASMAETKTVLVAAMSAGVNVAPQNATVTDVEEAKKMMAEMFPNDPAMLTYVESLYDSFTMEDGSFAHEKRDTADQKQTLVMDKDDMLILCDTQYMKNTIQQMIDSEMADATDAERAQQAEEIMAETKKLFEESGLLMTMDLYTLDEGATMMGADMVMSMSMVADGGTATVQLTGDYSRLTDSEGVSHKAEMVTEAYPAKVEFLFDLYRANSGKSTGLFGMLMDGEEYAVTYTAENTAPDTREREIAAYVRSDASAILPPAASARPLIGFSIKTEPAPADKLAALEIATPENSTNVFKLSAEGMNSLLSTVSTNAMQAYFTALGLLPTSVLNLMMGE